MSDDYELQNVTIWRLRELLQHEKDNQALRVLNVELRVALNLMTERFVACLISNGTDAEFATLAVADADALIAKAEGVKVLA